MKKKDQRNWVRDLFGGLSVWAMIIAWQLSTAEMITLRSARVVFTLGVVGLIGAYVHEVLLGKAAS
jgi:hypothetical protein